MTTTESSGREGAIATQVTQQGGELVTQAQQQMQQKAHELRSEAGVRLRTEVDERSTQAGAQTHAIGEALRKSSQQLRTEGKDTPARLVDQVAERADRLGDYLESTNADRLLRDVEDFARSRPWLTGAAAAAAGFLASRFLKASSSRRYVETYGGNGYRRMEHGSSTGASEPSTRGLPAGGA